MSAKKKKKKPHARQQAFGRTALRWVDEYKAETGRKVVNLDLVAAWAISTGRYQPPPADARKALARTMARLCREDYISDDDGEPVRIRHAYKITQGEQQLTLWVNMEDASRNQMRLCFSQRRRSVLKDCEQLDRDRKYYNKKYNPGEQIEIDFDYTKDMHEREESTEYIDIPPEDQGPLPNKPR